MAGRSGGWLRYELREKWEGWRERWREAPGRRWINERPKLIVTISCICIFLLAATIIISLMPARRKSIEASRKEWYYDLSTGKLFAADEGLIPPIEAPSGPLGNGEAAGVKACVLTYVAEPNEAEHFIGFLEMADPNGSDESEDGASIPGGAGRWGRGKLIRRVEDGGWVRADSEEGWVILEEAFVPNENGERPYYVRPK
jgi:hypothetical protein